MRQTGPIYKTVAQVSEPDATSLWHGRVIVRTGPALVPEALPRIAQRLERWVRAGDGVSPGRDGRPRAQRLCSRPPQPSLSGLVAFRHASLSIGHFALFIGNAQCLMPNQSPSARLSGAFGSPRVSRLCGLIAFPLLAVAPRVSERQLNRGDARHAERRTLSIVAWPSGRKAWLWFEPARPQS